MTETSAELRISDFEPSKPLSPGYLLRPFKWAAEPLAAMCQVEPQFLRHVFELDRFRMHVLAIALAHLEENPSLALAQYLMRSSTKDILARTLDRCPDGMSRFIHRLPYGVLSRQAYRALIALLLDRKSAKLMYHLDDAEITDAVIRMLHDIPAVLRPILAGLLDCSDSLEHFPQALEWLVARGAAADADTLTADLAAHVQPAQFVARLQSLIATLPLPDSLPPARVDNAWRIDATMEIRAISRTFRNCVADYMTQIDNGSCAIYLWQSKDISAVCRVSRHGRLGWCLSEMAGPRNQPLPRRDFQHIVVAFEAAAIPRYEIFQSIDSIICAGALRARDNLGRRRERDFLRLELERQAWEIGARN